MLAILFGACKDDSGDAVKTIASIDLTTEPTKTEYGIGEPLDLAGLVVTATYADGSTGSVSINQNNTDWDAASTRTGPGSITITIGEQTTQFTVTILTLAQRIDAIKGTAGEKTIYLYADETISTTQSLTVDGLEVILKTPEGSTAERVIAGTAGQSIFSVGYNNNASNNTVKLILDGYITLEGASENPMPLVQVYYHGSALEMKGHSKIANNNYSDIESTNSSNGGGVYLNSNTATGRVSLIMSDYAEISGNKLRKTSAALGGGVYASYADITLKDNAKISNNSVKSSNNTVEGGGVYLVNSTITLKGGPGNAPAISGNKIRSDSSAYGQYAVGGGVSVSTNSIFKMEGGVISNNTIDAPDLVAYSTGAGVNVTGDNGYGQLNGFLNFIKTGGVIYGDMDNAYFNDGNENTIFGRSGKGHALFTRKPASKAYDDNLLDNAAGNISF
ncbi:conserved hypothetical protein [Leadbettera azotonutricia ZAS-9]|uniref:Ig-like domain-containing protein n=2 Tax=Leadbettera azotonutricia TaxID=150829 RepID=F5Y8R5_LEAAZ|nr:conserved hypothetical protein [Leadbettera azotonutricia ZAS-9]